MIEYSRRLAKFDCISVRERSGQKVVWKILHRNARVSCDPTMLLTGYQWQKAFNLHDEIDKYIFIYYVEKTQELQTEAQKISHKYGIKTICMPCNTKFEVLSGRNDRNLCDEIDTTSSPVGFLNYVFNATYVFTNSYHGLIFSLLFHKQFLMKFNNENHTNERAKYLMETVGVLNRQLYKTDITESIDWSIVDTKINQIRFDGIEYLKNNLTL